jgi:hypothetical protein
MRVIVTSLNIPARVNGSASTKACASADDQRAAHEVLAVVARRRPREHQDLLLALQEIEVGLQVLFPVGGEVRRGDARDDPQHFFLRRD